MLVRNQYHPFYLTFNLDSSCTEGFSIDDRNTLRDCCRYIGNYLEKNKLVDLYNDLYKSADDLEKVLNSRLTDKSALFFSNIDFEKYKLYELRAYSVPFISDMLVQEQFLKAHGVEESHKIDYTLSRMLQDLDKICNKYNDKFMEYLSTVYIGVLGTIETQRVITKGLSYVYGDIAKLIKSNKITLKDWFDFQTEEFKKVWFKGNFLAEKPWVEEQVLSWYKINQLKIYTKLGVE